MRCPCKSASKANQQPIATLMKSGPIYTTYGNPEQVGFAVREVEKSLPKNSQGIVKVRATAITITDWSLVRGQTLPVPTAIWPVSLPRCQYPGMELARNGGCSRIRCDKIYRWERPVFAGYFGIWFREPLPESRLCK